MQKSKRKTIIIVIVVILIGVTFFYLSDFKTPANLINIGNPTDTNVNKIPEILGNKADLISCSVKSGSTISGNLAFNGIVKNGYFFEGNILINILDKNKTVLKTGFGSSITDWMVSGPVSFTGNIDLAGLPVGSAYFEIHNDNASGLPENDKSILIPVVIQ